MSTSITALICTFIFEQLLGTLIHNFRDESSRTSLPCLRSTLSACHIGSIDRCRDYCCPSGYFCSNSPIVGVYCKYGGATCGDHNWCLDFADIPGTCLAEACKRHTLVTRVITISCILAAVSLFLDLVDVISICTNPDGVVLKSGVNVFSAIMKFAAFGAPVATNVAQFLGNLQSATCFNSDGMELVAGLRFVFVSYVLLQATSAFLSLLLCPFSAYYGGKLAGIPYNK